MGEKREFEQWRGTKVGFKLLTIGYGEDKHRETPQLSTVRV